MSKNRSFVLILAAIAIAALWSIVRSVERIAEPHPETLAFRPDGTIAAQEKEAIARAPRTEVDPFASVESAARTPDAPAERLAFSDTMKLGDAYQKFLEAPAPIIGSNEKRIVLPGFPANTSPRTEAELALLHQYVALRTPAKVAQIREEVYLDGVKVGPATLKTYAEDPRYAKTGQAIQAVLDEINPVIFRLKTSYDRVRPHKLDPTLTTVIDVPEHPAYPSGHSTQAHAVAFLLTRLAPDRQAEFEADALRVAVNREIAGVHYPSDTAAGRLLARQIIDLMLEDPAFSALVEEAKAEWR